MLRRVVRTVIERIGRQKLSGPGLDLPELAHSFSRHLALAGCAGRCHMNHIGIGLVVIVTLAQARSYHLKLLAVVAQVAIERVRNEFDVDIKAVYWRHEASLGVERLTLADGSPSVVETPRAADEPADYSWDEHHRHRVEVKEIDLAEFETALQASQEQAPPEGGTTSLQQQTT